MLLWRWRGLLVLLVVIGVSAAAQIARNFMDPPFALILWPIAFAVYFLPAFVGWKKRNARAIAVLNGLLGWTGIGWVVALVWACTVDESPSK